MNTINNRGGGEKGQAISAFFPPLIFLFFISFNCYSENGKVDFNFQQIPLSEALTVYSDYTNTNMIIDSSIDDIIDLRLHNVYPSEVLNVLVNMYDLVKFNRYGITTVMKRKEFEERNNSQKIKVIQLKYLDSNDLLKSLKTKTNNNRNKHLSNSITSNKLTNSLIIQGTQSFIDRNSKLIKLLDKKQSQVQISAKLISISDVELKNLGLKLKSSLAASEQVFDSLVDLGVAASSTFSFLLTKAGKFALDIELDALQKNGTIEIVSKPTLITTNNKRARISQGVQIPYQVQDRDGAFHNEFKDAVLSLSVLPRISGSDIYLDVAITKDSPADTTASEILIDTRSISSSINLKSGQTVILGGIKDSEISHTINRVPYLSDIPYLGSWLFTSYSDTNNKRSLVVFITPSLI